MSFINRTDKKSFGCAPCRKAFTFIAELKVHERRKHGIRRCYPFKVFPCPSCMVVNFRKVYVPLHERRYHKPRNPSATNPNLEQSKAGNRVLSKADSIRAKRPSDVSRKESLFCFLCAEIFATPEDLQIHEDKHFASDSDNPKKEKGKRLKNFECSSCQKRFISAPFLARHLRKAICRQQKETPQDSGINEDQDLSAKNLEEKRTKRLKNFECSSCQKRFISVPFLARHLRKAICRRQKETPEDSGINEDQDLSAKNLEEERRKRLKDFECPLCRKKFITAKWLAGHVRRAICRQQKGSSENFQIHEEDQHLSARNLEGGQNKNRLRNLACPVCQKRFVSPKFLENHIRKAKCTQRKETSELLGIHENLEHSTNNPEREKKKRLKNLACPMCLKRFASSKWLEGHIRRAKCSQRKESLSKKTLLNCGVCGKLFYRRKLLESHERLHSLSGHRSKKEKIVDEKTDTKEQAN